ncbi:MAG: glycosyltransferase [Cyclobacteriaceae bacterium]|nr:glycosyltransferase [Cyclobacteriaceae bacterium]MCH8515079.1 glycosyltransferase [Cyclobacteriaceae bacterium]
MTKESKKAIFIVQGEGRGHMSQAIAAAEQLRSNGVEIIKILLGCSSQREIPHYFESAVKTTIECFQSPNFIKDSSNKHLELSTTFKKNLSLSSTFLKSVKQIHLAILASKADFILNFYEPLCGLYAFRYRKHPPIYSFAHQYLVSHPEFPRPAGRSLEIGLMKLLNRISSFGSKRVYALSFAPYSPHPKQKIKICPPLIREQVKRLGPENKGFWLAYFVNSGYAEELKTWSDGNVGQEIHAFGDGYNASNRYNGDLSFHPLDADVFLKKMSQCDALISTAGFESICEAMYLGKRIFMVPIGGSVEQVCNALDAQKHYHDVQIGDSFTQLGILERVKVTSYPHSPLKKWEKQIEHVWKEIIEDQS